jgi:aspartate/tyrosine/aromatic aminotransferase
LFETLSALPPDAILTLIGEYENDSRDVKIDLGVGVYRDESGQTPILNVVKKAEQFLVDTQPTKSYLGSGGNPDFNEAIQALTFGDTATDERITTLQTPGGSARKTRSLRLGE